MRRISLLLSLCLLLFALAGCRGTNDAGDTAEPPAPETEQAAPEESQSPEHETTPEVPEETPEQPSPEEIPEEVPEEPEEELETPETEEPEPEETSAETSYTACSAYSKEEIEAFAAKVRQAVLDKDWDTLAQNTVYAIAVGSQTFLEESEFAAADWDSILSEDFIQAIEKESCQDMFNNFDGVMMGDGQIWFNEVLDIDGNSEGLKVIAINP